MVKAMFSNQITDQAQISNIYPPPKKLSKPANRKKHEISQTPKVLDVLIISSISWQNCCAWVIYKYFKLLK
jgi:hypothetical protein